MRNRTFETKRNLPARAASLTVVMLASLLAPVAGADGYELAVGAFIGGGGTSSHGDLELIGSIGDASAGVAAGGRLVLSGGVMSGTGDSSIVFSDGFESGQSTNWSSTQGGDAP